MGGRSGKVRRTVSAGDLTKGVIVVLSGGFVDWMNPPEVLGRMGQYIADVNADPYVQAHTNGKGLKFKLLSNQGDPHIHQAQWDKVARALATLKPSPLILVGHSFGGAAAAASRDRSRTAGRRSICSARTIRCRPSTTSATPTECRPTYGSTSIPM